MIRNDNFMNVCKVTVTTIQSIPEYAMPTQWTFFLEDNDFDEVNP